MLKEKFLASHHPSVGQGDSVTNEQTEQETRVSEPEMHSAANSRLSVLLHTDLKLLLYNVPKMLAQRQLSLKVPDRLGRCLPRTQDPASASSSKCYPGMATAAISLLMGFVL